MITKGTKVAVMPGTDYNNRLVNQIGIVKISHGDKIGVQLDGFTNPYSQHGLYWFNESSLAVIPECDAVTELSVKQIIYSGPKTVVIWSDGSKTIISCSETDTYDQYAGFCAAVTKKMFGSNSNIKKIIDKYAKVDRPMFSNNKSKLSKIRFFNSIQNLAVFCAQKNVSLFFNVAPELISLSCFTVISFAVCIVFFNATFDVYILF